MTQPDSDFAGFPVKNEEEQDLNPNLFRLDKYRWIIVTFWSLSLCSSTIIMSGFVPYSKQIKAAYDVGEF